MLDGWYDYQGDGRGIYEGIPYRFGVRHIADDRDTADRTIQDRLKKGKIPGAGMIISGVCSGWKAAPAQLTYPNVTLSPHSRAIYVWTFVEAATEIEKLAEGETLTIIVQSVGSSRDTVYMVSH